MSDHYPGDEYEGGTICNYCSLEEIKRRAKAAGQKVELTPNQKWGGVDVTINGKFQAWFMELTDKCAC